MTIVLNEAALSALLETQDGPVGQFVEGVAQRVAVAAQQNVLTYFAGAPTLDVHRDIGVEMEGSDAIIGIQDAGSKARRLAQGQADGRINWLTNALEAVRE